MFLIANVLKPDQLNRLNSIFDDADGLLMAAKPQAVAQRG